jgi:hypothetical protein
MLLEEYWPRSVCTGYCMGSGNNTAVSVARGGINIVGAENFKKVEFYHFGCLNLYTAGLLIVESRSGPRVYSNADRFQNN